MSAPLDGIRVIDFTRVLTGPHCTKTLRDLGAEVVKIEPPSGDLGRVGLPIIDGLGLYFVQQNAGKRNISIDLNWAEAREIVLEMCRTADIIVENFRQGTLARFGLGYDAIKAINPRVIYASLSGYVVRFLLGGAEAGYFPGVMLYFTYWLPNRYRGQAVSWMFLAYALSNSITPVISAYIFKMNGLLGIEGWRFMFVLEALPAILLAIPVLLYLPDRPKNCKWLTSAEAEWLEQSISAPQLDRGHAGTMSGFWSCLKDFRVLGFCAMWFTVLTAGYGTTFFLPLMIKAASSATTMQVGVLSAIPYLVAIVGLVVFGYTSDRFNERFWHYLAFSFISAAGFFAAAYWRNPEVTIIGLSFAALGIYATRPAFWAAVTQYMNACVAASGLALVSAVGSLGGFLGPYMIGSARTASHDYESGLYLLSVVMFIAAVLGVMTIPRGTLRERLNNIGRTAVPSEPTEHY